jgi:DNA-binding NtrC family response regulator
VRELRNAIERAVVLCRGERITVEDLLLEDGAGEEVSKSGDETLEQSLDRAAAESIRGALEQSGGRRVEAARRLGIDRTTLYRWMKRLGVEMGEYKDGPGR